MELLFLLSIGKNFFTALETNKKTPDQNGRVFFFIVKLSITERALLTRIR